MYGSLRTVNLSGKRTEYTKDYLVYVLSYSYETVEKENPQFFCIHRKEKERTERKNVTINRQVYHLV